jgi:hypothetical protein
VLLLAAFVTAATVAILGFGEGRIPVSAWTEFTAPDGTFTLELPGVPSAERVEPNPASPATRGGQRFVTSGWYSGARAWVGWQDLDPEWARSAKADRDDVFSLAVVHAERDRRKAEVGGTITKEGPVKFGDSIGRVVQMETPRGQLVEHYVLVLEAKQPRLYFMGLEAKTAVRGGEPGPDASRIFTSFRVTEK